MRQIFVAGFFARGYAKRLNAKTQPKRSVRPGRFRPLAIHISARGIVTALPNFTWPIFRRAIHARIGWILTFNSKVGRNKNSRRKLFVRKWLAALDDFRNWLIREAA